MFHYTVESSKTVQEAVASLEQHLQAAGFGILWDFDLQAKLVEKGLEFEEPYRILEVCNPKEAEKVLSRHKAAGNFLPCKITVYKENDVTYIGMPRPTVLIGFIEDEHLKQIAEDVEERMQQSIDQSI